MSGAEFIAVASVIGNVVAVLNFCNSVVLDTIALHKKRRDVPKAFESLQVILPLVELTLTKTKARIDAGELDKDTARSLAPALENCSAKVNELANVFRRMRPGENTGRFKLFFKSASNLSQQGKVDALAEEIMRYQLIIYQAGAVPLSTPEIEKTVEKAEVKLDGKVENLVSQLKEKAPVPSSMPSSLSLGSANASTQNFQTNSSTVSFNGQTQITNHYNVYHAQVVGVMMTDTGPVPRVVEGMQSKMIEGDTSYPLKKKISQAPAVAAVQFETPHLSGISDNSSVPLIDLDSKSEPSTATTTNSSRLPEPHDPNEALSSALSELREASAGTTEYPGIARQRYHNALKTLSLITEKSTLDYALYTSSSTSSPSSPSSPLGSDSDALLFRRSHLQTLAELGLSQVELPAAPHMRKAQAFNDAAFSIAGRANDPGLLVRARLNKAHLKAREARVDEKTGLSTKSKVRTLRYEAFEGYTRAAADMRGKCSATDDYDVLAQALLGCGRMSKKLSQGSVRLSWGSTSPEKKGLGRPETYFDEALRVIEEGVVKGQREGVGEKDIDELKAIGDAVGAALGVVELE